MPTVPLILPPTIAESFDLPIPAGEDRHKDADVKISSSSTTTANSHHPLLAIEASYDVWGDYARSVLGKVNLKDYRLATWEKTRFLRNEADVSDAASPQLINSVDLALASLHKSAKIKSINQAMNNSARADRVWFRDVNSAGDGVAFAVLDYKNVGAIKDKGFEVGTTTEKDYPKFGEKVKTTSLFGGNAAIILKQAVHYRAQYMTRYIAFFDWDRLVLLVMRKPEHRRDWDGGRWCYITIVSDKFKMRCALLGFLECAYQASVDDSWKPPHPLEDTHENPLQKPHHPSDGTRSHKKD